MNTQGQGQLQPFHLAIPSNNISKSRQFYGEILGCEQGRTDPNKWIDYNYFGNQLVTHFATSTYTPKTIVIDNIPVPNFGVYLSEDQFNSTRAKLDSAKVEYTLLEKSGEKGQVLHVRDFTGNNLLFHKRQ